MYVSTEYELNVKLQNEYENMIRMNHVASALATDLESQLKLKYGYKQEELFAIWDDAEKSSMNFRASEKVFK